MTPEEYVKQHKEAFRCAFDFLNTHFPPGEVPAWWDQTAKDCSNASVSAGESEIVLELLNGVMNYLGTEYKRRTEHGKVND